MIVADFRIIYEGKTNRKEVYMEVICTLGSIASIFGVIYMIVKDIKTWFLNK